MLRELVVTGGVGLGLVGGVGAVTYDDDGDAKVTITDGKTGKKASVELRAGDGKTFMCPATASERVDASNIRAGRVKITMRRVRGSIKALERRYPSGEAPGVVVDRYNGLARRHKRLVRAFNVEVERHNAIIEAECDPPSEG